MSARLLKFLGPQIEAPEAGCHRDGAPLACRSRSGLNHLDQVHVMVEVRERGAALAKSHDQLA